jgi:DNA-binding GntR family transcriptional regulator
MVANTTHGGRGLVRPSLHDQLVERLREMIVETDLAPGERVDEKSLCEDFGISRTPLREALKVMASEGLIELQPNRSPRVTPLTPESVGDLFEMISWLDRQTGKIAARKVEDADLRTLRRIHRKMVGLHERGDRVEYYRMNREFHTAIVGIVGNAVLSVTYATLTAQAQRARFIAIHAQAHWDRGVREHERMIELLEARDGPALGDLLAAHALETGMRVRAILAERDPEDAEGPATA